MDLFDDSVDTSWLDDMIEDNKKSKEDSAKSAE